MRRHNSLVIIFPHHLLLNDFVLLGVLGEAFGCTFQVPKVDQAMQSTPVMVYDAAG